MYYVAPGAPKNENHTVYMHSASRDFSETQRLPEALYLGRFPERTSLVFFHCACENPNLTRIGRAPWMRVLPFFRLYRCLACGSKVYRIRARQRTAYGAVYPSAPPAPSTPSSKGGGERVRVDTRALIRRT